MNPIPWMIHRLHLLIQFQINNQVRYSILFQIAKKNMKFLTTILWPIRLWQILAITPFGLTKKTFWPNRESSLHYFAMACLAVHIAALIHGIIVPGSFADMNTNIIDTYNDQFAMGSIRFLICAIIIEAILYRNDHIDVFELINQIDLNLEGKLRLMINYKKNQFQNNIIFGIWLVVLIMSIILVFVFNHLSGDEQFERYWLFYIIPFSITTLHYQRIFFYVHLLRYRYQMLNDFLLNICSIQELQQNDDLSSETKLNNSIPLLTAIQIRDFRNIYQQLYEASIQMNDIFWWSMPLCILIDFHSLLVNSYWTFLIFLTHSSENSIVVSLIWGGCNAARLLLLSHACHSTSISVSLNRYKI